MIARRYPAPLLGRERPAFGTEVRREHGLCTTSLGTQDDRNGMPLPGEKRSGEMTVGRADALKRGVRFGRPKKMNEDQRKLAARLLREGKSVREVARTFSVHPATLYRILTPAA